MPGNQYFAYRSFWPELKTIKRFADAGVNTVCFFPANTVNSLGEPYCKYSPNWLWFDTYDFSVVDQQIADIVSVNPNAEFLCMVDLNSPLWLSRQLSLAHEAGDSFTQLSQALCNPEWQKAMTAYLEAFLRHCEAHHGDLILSYILASGHTDEWLDHSAGAAGPTKAAAYERWRNKKALLPATVPDSKQLNTVVFDGLLHDPKVDASVLDYWRFTNETVGDAIIDFATSAKTWVRPEVEIGAFYGYVMDRIGPVTSGHADYEKVLASPAVDFLVSPGTYKDREMGGGSGFLTVAGSEALAGKKHLHECDQRTHTYNRDLSPHVALDFPCWPDTQSDIAGMKREAALSLIQQNSLWWFDMWGGFYQEPELFENLKTMKQIWDRLSGEEYTSVAEVALIVDPDSLPYFDQGNPRQGDFTLHARKQLNRLGAPFDVYSFNDLPRLPDVDRYRLIIFANPIEITSAKAKLLEQTVLNHDRMVLWLYAPGLSDGESLESKRVLQWAGVDYGASGLAVTQRDGWVSAYLHQPTELSPAMLKQLAVKAGVHLYCDQEQPVYANHRLLAVHTSTGGKQRIELPREYQSVVELFGDKLVAENIRSFEWEFASPDTALFLLEEHAS